MDDGWEARMAARAAARRAVGGASRTVADSPILTRFTADHPDLGRETTDAIMWAIGELNDYDPSLLIWSAAEMWSRSTNTCRNCYEARPYPAGQRHFGWSLWRICGGGRCHDGGVCHDGEVWIG